MHCARRGSESVPIYSADSPEYGQRVYRNERDPDQNFAGDEFLFRRFPKSSLVNGWPTPLTIFPIEQESGISVNRSRYSLPQDVLEPDCCNGNHRTGMIVLEFAVSDLPDRIAADGREYAFVPKHVPHKCCYATARFGVIPAGISNGLVKNRQKRYATYSGRDCFQEC